MQRGQLIDRGKNKWLVRVYMGQDSNGKRRYVSKTVRGMVSEAQKVLTKMLREQDTDTLVLPSKVTLREWCLTWLAGKQGQITETTHTGYVSSLTRYVYPSLGETKLQDVTAARIRVLYAHLQESLSGTTVLMVHRILRQVLGAAYRDGVLQKNPTDFVKAPRKAHTEMVPLTPEQVRALLTANADEPLYPLWLLLLTTGLRPSEALALRWEDVSEDGFVSVRRSLRGALKTKSSVRSISLPETTRGALRAHRKAQARFFLGSGYRTDLIFCSRVGTPLDVDNVRHGWKAALKRADLPASFRLYDCRHTHATALLAAGVHMKAMADRLGHSTIRLTADTYSHVTREIDERTAEKCENIFKLKEGTNG